MKNFKLLMSVAMLVGSVGAKAQTIGYDASKCDKVVIGEGLLMQERILETCGGSIRVVKYKGRIAFSLLGIENCNSLFIGVNAKFESDGYTRKLQDIDEDKLDYSSWTVSPHLVISPDDADLARVRLVLFSNSEKTCTKIEIQPGKLR